MNPPFMPRRILMTVDAVGGVWRYAMDLAGELAQSGIEIVFAGFGPSPKTHQIAEAAEIGELLWLGQPLDWMAKGPEDLKAVPGLLSAIAAEYEVDLLHLNLPSQADGLQTSRPVVVVSHSCVSTWFKAVRGGEPPADWLWHWGANRRGLDRADRVIAPSRSHAAALLECYGPLPHLSVVHNASKAVTDPGQKQEMVFAAGRWWDEGKNGRLLDEAARLTETPVLMAGATIGPNGERLELRFARGLGAMPYAAMLSVLSDAAIFASPSLFEPFGLSVLEAALSGSALVLSDIPTYRELWDGAALFASPYDAESFAAAIRLLARDHGRREALATEALRRAWQFSLDRQAAEMMALYAETIPAARLSQMRLSSVRS
ncbi:glycosyltransferase family 4 protein [Rhizobium paknamense]|uniref:Glycosyltransferase involved in cell wall biosynthesis n=1 Tax=Rhizobium paknamense TaxID=1206817 RepID=A0ABU0IHV8_9HYPH|nr:glycosyltransferase family 4 protein [Rhizobium paknamense]MDQ0457845.1 glycosyltransferase involved in cell wall biosynthesis [Rhizobium paknamense]